MDPRAGAEEVGNRVTQIAIPRTGATPTAPLGHARQQGDLQGREHALQAQADVGDEVGPSSTAVYSDDTVEDIASAGAFYNKSAGGDLTAIFSPIATDIGSGTSRLVDDGYLGIGRHAREEGQALVELSLCAGFLCLMLLAVWQVGTIFSNYIDISEAARSGARAAALSGAPTTTGDAPSLTTAVSEGSSQRRTPSGARTPCPPSPARACPE